MINHLQEQRNKMHTLQKQKKNRYRTYKTPIKMSV